MNKALVFSPGCDWKIDRHVLFVEYESMTGEHIKARFDLSAGTEYVVDRCKTLSFDIISKPESKLQYSIQKIVYFEKECNSMVAFTRGCKQNRLLIPTKVYFDKIKRTTTPFNFDSDRVKMINDRIARNELNSAYGIVSRDWADVLADSARYIINHPERKLYISTGSQFCDWKDKFQCAIEEERRDRVVQWLKEPPKPIEFISDDLENCEKGVPNTKLIDTERLYFKDTFHMTGEMKLLEGVKNFTPKLMTFRGKTWTHPKSTYGEQGHMLIVDPVGKTYIRPDDYLEVEVGDVMYYDDGDNGKAEPNEHGKLFVWRGLGVGWEKFPDNSGYFDTDMASMYPSKMTVPEVKYCMNDVVIQANVAKQLEMYGYCLGADFDGDTIMQIKLFKEELQMAEKTRFDMYKPKISKVIFNEPATIVFWTDGTKTIVKCGENEIPDDYVAFCAALGKKVFGSNSALKRAFMDAPTDIRFP